MSSVSSPCRNLCRLSADGSLCEGCGRTLEEIGAWLQMGDAERQRMMDVVLPAREAARA